MSRTSVDSQCCADLILVNGNVLTVDSQFSVAQAIAVKDGRIVAVGTNRDVKAFAGRRTTVLDVRGKTILPGINDSHVHAALWGGTRPPIVLDVGYPSVKSISDVVALVAEKVKTAKPGEWIRGFGWDEGFLEECAKDNSRHPTRWDLDPVSPDNPVCLTEYTVHSAWVNSKALEVAGIRRDTPVPQGDEIEADPSTGELTGIIRGLGAQTLITKAMPPLTKGEKREAILSAIREFNSLGITSITEGALGPGGTGYQGGLLDSECISEYNDLYNEGKLNARVNIFYLFGEYGACSSRDLQEIVPHIGIHSGFGNEWLRIGGIKIFADGVPPSKTAWITQEYAGGGSGGLVVPGATERDQYEELVRMVRYAHSYGFQIAAHAAGDRAIAACIDAFITAEKDEPRELRHYVVHGDFISAEYARLAAKWGIGVAAQPAIKWTLADYMVSLVGEERSAWQWPLRTLIDAGVHVAASSDAPVTYPNWKQAVQSAVLRESKAAGRISGPEQRITQEEATRMFTIEGAWLERLEALKGSIEVGKLADFCVLGEDILKVEPHQIKDIPTVMTIVGGRIVYDVGEIPG